MTLFAARFAGARYGPLAVVHSVALDLEQDELLVLLGSNGAGKSTTLRAIIGTVACDSRSIALAGDDISRLAPWDLPSRGVALVPDGARCFANLTVLDNLRGAFLATQGRRPRDRLAALLAEVFLLFPVLQERRTQFAGTLSGGQRQMLAIGRALMTEPRVLLLDEPSAGLAPKVVEELFEALAAIKRNNACAILMAEQNVGYAAQVADRCLVLEEGHVAIEGRMADVVKREEMRVAYLGL